MNFGRRGFIGLGLGAGLGFAQNGIAATDPYSRKERSNLQPALAAYSFRNYFPFVKGKPNKSLSEEKQMDMKQFIHFCADQGVAAELTSYFFPPDAENSYFTDCRMEAHLNGIGIAGTAVGNQFTLEPSSDEAKEQMTYVKQWIDRAVLMGAPHIRVFAGRIPKGMDEATAEKHAIVALEEAGEYAESKGVFLGLENHDSIGTSEKLLALVKAVDNPRVGVNLDSGNFRTEDPYGDFANSVPFAVNVQVKASISVGGVRQPTDFEKLFGILREKSYSGFVVLEYEENEDPFTEIPPLLDKIKLLSQP